MSSSQYRRLPTPASARTFCSRTPPGTSVSESRSPSSSSSSSSSSAAKLRSGVFILDILYVLRQERRQVGQVIQAGQAQPLEKVAGGPVQDGPGLGVRPRFLGQAAQDQ